MGINQFAVRSFTSNQDKESERYNPNVGKSGEGSKSESYTDKAKESMEQAKETTKEKMPDKEQAKGVLGNMKEKIVGVVPGKEQIKSTLSNAKDAVKDHMPGKETF